MPREGWRSGTVTFPTRTVTKARKLRQICLAARSGQVGMVVWAVP